MSSITRQSSAKHVSSVGASYASFNFPLVCPSGNSRLVVVGVNFEEDYTNSRHVTSVTVGGTSMIEVSGSPIKFPDTGLQASVALFYALDSDLPATGGSTPIVVTLDGVCSDEICSYVVEYSDVNQSPPDDTAVHENTSSGDTSVTLTAAASGSVGVLACGSGARYTLSGYETNLTTVQSTVASSSAGGLGELLNQSGTFTFGYHNLVRREGCIGAVWQPNTSSSGSIAQIGATGTANLESASSLTLSSYKHPGGTNTAVVVCAVNKKRDFVSVTYGGTALTQLVENVSADYRSSIWYIVGLGVTVGDVVLTISSSEGLAMSVTSWEHVHQLDPFRSFASAAGDNTNPTVACASAANDVVIDCMVDELRAYDPTAGSGQTELSDMEVNHKFRHASSRKAGDANGVTMAWAAYTDKKWSVCAGSLRSASGGYPLVNAGHSIQASAGTGSTSHVVSTPTHSEGDLIVVCAALDQASNAANLVKPAGFTSLVDNMVDSGSPATQTKASLWFKTAGASEPSTYTFTSTLSERSLSLAWSVSNHNGIDVLSAAQTGTSATLTFADATTTADQCLVVRVACTDGETLPHSIGVGYTALASHSLSSGGATLSIQHTQQAVPGTTGTLAVSTAAIDEWSTRTFAIAPTPHAAASPTYPGHMLYVGDNSNQDKQDANVIAFFEGIGWTVTYKYDGESQTSDADGKDVVFLSNSVDSGSVEAKFRDVAIGVVCAKYSIYDDMGMCTTGGGSSSGSVVNIVDATHKLAAGYSAGTTSVYTVSEDRVYGNPNSNATIIAQIGADATQAVIFAYESGAAMPGLTAPARRVGHFLRYNSFTYLTQVGRDLLEESVKWAQNAYEPTSLGAQMHQMVL